MVQFGGMAPEEIEEAKKKIGELEEEEATPRWETGYRGWKLKFQKGKPRLGSVAWGAVWEPGEEGEVVSDWKEGEDEPFEKTSKGLYSLRSLQDVKQRYGGEDIYGAIIPYGKTFFGEMGYRSEKAKVRSLFKGLVSCYICKKPARYYVHNDERFPLCESCLKRLEKLIKKKGYSQEEVEEVLHQLAEIYEAEVVDAPED